MRYAAAYIHPAVERVWIEDEAWWVESAELLPQTLVDEGFELLCRRFGSVELPPLVPRFTLAPPAGLTAPAAEIDPARFQPSGPPGLFILRTPYSDLMRFFDWITLWRFARAFGARDELYPNVIPIEQLALTQHLRAFPEHLHFVSHLSEDLRVLESFAARARATTGPVQPEAGELAPVALMHNPSTCYHCYAARRGAQLPDNEAVTAVTRCHRYESANHSDPGRLMEFTLREIIFIGSADYVRETRETCMKMIEDWATAWSLYGELLPANDPFFTDDYEAKAVHQHRLAMKYEYRAVLPGTGRTLAVLSSNLHAATFGKAFDIRVGGMRANTGCLGFGLERLAIAVVMQHGLDPARWPEGLRRDYALWQAADALRPSGQP
ncbi:MAG TPA: hypothetical protein VKZ87_08790 [Ferrovibrio sp.]|uniref:hypothetical protein n=1 Tax=Ferrovibrio sp. TaxID=1917215 RepID=UPI002B4B6E58|nr:hypothetical protein [Ferrovibrio sp.]HLT77468.1 hypothetical protein [Ferrovibrio sp.]